MTKREKSGLAYETILKHIPHSIPIILNSILVALIIQELFLQNRWPIILKAIPVQ